MEYAILVGLGIVAILLVVLLVRTSGKQDNSALEAKLEELSEKNEKDKVALQTSIDALGKNSLISDSKLREELRNTINANNLATDQKLANNFKQVSDSLNNLFKALGDIEKLSGGVESLNRTISNVKTRGVWGEQQLKAILQETMTPQQYDANVATKKGSQDRVEFAIKLPSKGDGNGFTYLPIDSKFPSDIMEKISVASEAMDKPALDLAVKELTQRIKDEAKQISSKYIDPPHTTDFAIMFLPTESLYAEVLRIADLSEFCQNNHRIMIAGPTTVTALLNSLRVGFANVALNEKSVEVIKLLRAVKKQCETFASEIVTAENRINTALNGVQTLKKRTELIQKKMSSMEEMTLQDSNGILGIDSQDDI